VDRNVPEKNSINFMVQLFFASKELFATELFSFSWPEPQDASIVHIVSLKGIAENPISVRAPCFSRAELGKPSSSL
jgi:hypothetical protein